MFLCLGFVVSLTGYIAATYHVPFPVIVRSSLFVNIHIAWVCFRRTQTFVGQWNVGMYTHDFPQEHSCALVDCHFGCSSERLGLSFAPSVLEI